MKTFYEIINAMIEEKAYEEKLKKFKNPIEVEKYAKHYKKILEKEASNIKKGIRFEQFAETLEEYIKQKDDMTEDQKVKYLKYLYKLSKIYDIDLRKELEGFISNKPKSKDKFYKNLHAYLSKKKNITEEEKKVLLKELVLLSKEHDLNVKEELKKIKQKPQFHSPLENKLFLMSILYERYMNCHFEISEIYLPKQKKPKKKQNYFNKEIINELSTTNSNKDYCIFINSSNRQETYLFLKELKKDCTAEDINITLNPYEDDENINYHTTIYVEKKDLLKCINILKNINLKHPEWTKNFGTPPAFGTQEKDSYFCITPLGLLNDKKEIVEEFIPFFKNICEIAYYRVLAKMSITKIISIEEQECIKKFITLNEVNLKENHSLTEITFSNIPLKQIKDIINKTIPNIQNTLKLYMEKQNDILIEEFKKSILYLINILIYNKKSTKDNYFSVNN